MKNFEEMREYLGIDDSTLANYPEFNKTIEKALELQEMYSEQIKSGEMGMGLHADFYGNQKALEGEGKKLSSVIEEAGVVLYKIERLEKGRITCKQILLTQLDYMNTILEDIKRSLNDNSKYGLLRNVCENVVDYIGEYIDVEQEPISNTIRIDIGYLYGYLDLENMSIYFNADEMDCETTLYEDLKYEILCKSEEDLLEMDGYGMFEYCLKDGNNYSLEYKSYLDGAACVFNANDEKNTSLDEIIFEVNKYQNSNFIDFNKVSYELGKLMNLSIVDNNEELNKSVKSMLNAIGMSNIQQKEVAEGIIDSCGDAGSNFGGYTKQVLSMYGFATNDGTKDVIK